MMPKTKKTKGVLAEEALRQYFMALGFFVVRGARFRFREYEITDVDLWLYMKKSLTREIINVDIKNKKTPQAIERIFWTKGLQEVLKCDKCIVATTDRRPATRDFGALHGVIVLDGSAQNKIIANFSGAAQAVLDEDDILSILRVPSVLDSKISLDKIYLQSKETLLSDLNYNGFNVFLNNSKVAIEEYLARHTQSQAPLKLLYASIAFMLLAVDYKCRELGLLETSQRKEELADGFRFGEAGKERANEILETAMALAANVGDSNLFTRSMLRAEVEQQLTSYPAEELASFFAKAEVMKSLFDMAKNFYSFMMAKETPPPTAIDSQYRAIVGLLADVHKIDRRKLL